MITFAPTSEGCNLPRKVEYFESPQEILRAVYDAVSNHQRTWKSAGAVHGNVNPDMLFIGPGDSSTQNCEGFLKSPGPYDKLNPMFQSVMTLSRTVSLRPSVHPPDYLDDLESFYYIIAWFALAYTGPGHRRARKDFPPVLACWAPEPDYPDSQCSAESVIRKETILLAGGFGFGHVSSVLGGKDMERLLQSLNSIIRGRYLEKLSLRRVMTWEEISKVSEVVYDDFLWQVRKAIKILDSMEENKRTQALIVSHGGLFPEDLAAMLAQYPEIENDSDDDDDW